MAHHKVVQVIAEERVLGKPIIMESDKVQSIFLHVDFVKTRVVLAWEPLWEIALGIPLRGALLYCIHLLDKDQWGAIN